jgi:peptidoglycan hydrolase-like protein with peptidoglycan-binding domain
MKLTPFAVAVAAAFSMSAIAADEKQKDAQSQGAQQSSQTQSAQQGSQSSQSPEMVKQAQEKLSAAGHDAGEADGIMGPKTQSALKEFQESKGLQASGELDQKTMAALGISGGSSSAGASSSPSSSSGGSAPSSSSGASSPSATSGASSEKSSEKSK